jgi:hypothetical protein
MYSARNTGRTSRLDRRHLNVVMFVRERYLPALPHILVGQIFSQSPFLQECAAEACGGLW